MMCTNSVMAGVHNKTFNDLSLGHLIWDQIWHILKSQNQPCQIQDYRVHCKDTASCLSAVLINQALLSCQNGHQGLLHRNAYSKALANQCRHTNSCSACKGGLPVPFQAKLISCQKKVIHIIPKGSLRTCITIPITHYQTHDGNSKK